MSMRLVNFDIQLLMKKQRVRYYEVAAALGVHPCTLTRWMRREMTPERRELVLRAVERIGK